MTLPKQDNPITALAFSPDGKTLASATGFVRGGAGELALWNSAKGVRERILAGNRRSIFTLEWASDGVLFSGGGEPGQPPELLAWDMPEGKIAKNYDTIPGGFVTSVAVEATGKSLVVSHFDRTFVLLDRKTGKIVTTFKGHTADVIGVAVSPDGKWIASACEDRTVRVWQAATGKELLVLNGHTKAAASVVFIPNSQLLASGGTDGVVNVWDLSVGLNPKTVIPEENNTFARFENKKGGFRVLLPGKPDEKTKKIPTLDGELTLNIFVVKDPRAFYGVMYTPLPPASLKSKTAAQHLDDAVFGALTVGAKKLDDQPIKLGDHPGRELLMSTEQDQVYSRIRVYFFRGTIYQVMVSGPGRRSVFSADANRFFDSFRDIPLPLTAAERAAKEKELEQLLEKGQAAKAGKDYLRAVCEFEKIRGLAHEIGGDMELVWALANGQLAELQTVYMGRPDLAEPLYRDAIGALEGSTDPEVIGFGAMLMSRLAQLYQQQKDYARAEPLLRRAIVRAGGNKEVLSMAKIILAQVYLAQEQHVKAEPLFLEGIEAGKGIDDPAGFIDVARCQLAKIRKKRGLFDEAEKQLRALVPAANAPAKEPTAAYLAVAALLNLYFETGKPDQALELAARVPELAKRATPTSEKALAAMYLAVYKLYLARGDLVRAEAASVDCLQKLEASFGPKHPSVADLYGQIGAIKMQRGEMAGSETAFRRALEILDDPARPNSLEKAQILHYLAQLYVLRTDYIKAEQICQQIIRMLAVLKVPEQELIQIDVRATWAIALISTGREGEAMTLLDGVIKAIDENADETIKYAGVLMKMIELHRSAGQLSKAEPLMKRLSAIIDREFGPEHPFSGMLLAYLSRLHLEANRPEEGLKAAQRAAVLLEQSTGKNSIFMMLNLMNIGRIHMARGDRAQAKQALERCYQVLPARLGNEHPIVARLLLDLAELNAWSGDFVLAAKRYDEARRIDFRFCQRTLPALAENQQVMFLEYEDAPGFAKALSFALTRPNDNELVTRSAEWVLNGKGTALQILAERQILARQSDDPTVQKLLQDWFQVRQELAGLTLSVAEPGKELERGQQLARLRNIETILGQQVGAAIGRTERNWIELNTVRKALPRDGVLIEFVRLVVLDPMQPGGKKDQKLPSRPSTRYVAWIIPAEGDSEPVRMIDLGPAKEIEGAIRLFRERMGMANDLINGKGERAAVERTQEPLEELSRLLLKPLLPHIGKKARWMISPDGETWLVPFAALPIDEDLYAIEKHQISYVASGRDLLWTAPKIKTNSPLVMANPDYYLDFEEARQETRRVLNQLPPPPAAPRQLNVKTFGRFSQKWSILEGTTQEVELILPNLKTYAGTDPRVYRGKQATEGVFRAVQRPSVVVLATHGSIVEPQSFSKAASPDNPKQLFTEVPSEQIILTAQSENALGQSLEYTTNLRDMTLMLEHPALCCGLVLAGANKRGQGDPNGEDGILTAWEILGVDLRGTRLVVLSACETALGRVQEERGIGAAVSGLRQAFQVAGAQKVVATLWKIPDDDTALLMEDFFKRLAAGDSEETALRAAQLARLEAHRKANDKLGKKRVAHPFFWAAFTITSQGR